MTNYDYAMIGNCTTAALISSDCSIDWLCLPFFDSPFLFGRLLDKDKGGYFKISGVDTVRQSQNYIANTAIFKTIFETKNGVFEVRDYMPRFHTIGGEVYCPPEIQRDIHVLSGKPKMIVEFCPKPNYALSEPEFIFEDHHVKILSKTGDFNSTYLYSNLDYKKIINGEPIELSGSSFLLLSYYEKLEEIKFNKIYVEYEKTKSYWLDWVYRTKLPDKYQAMVVRSTITLKLLTYQRTGAVVAAPTTSLPEIIGRERNWDYRFCWVRDGSMIIDLYARIGHMKLSGRYINFILNRMLLKHEDIAVVYGINGERVLVEKSLEHLSGYENSKPVRIGNDAYRQRQNDLYGEFIETIYAYYFIHQRDKSQMDEELWTNICSLVTHAQRIWKQPDCGIWERRGEMKHYVHSKMMNWVAMDRAAKIATLIGKKEYAKQWRETATEIKEDILTRGWSDKVQSFVMCYDCDHLDASTLLMLHYGFLDRKDPRIVSTVKQIHKHLVKNNYTFRYMEEDDFGFPENAFLVCSFWMINALYLIGEEDQARKMFEHISKCANQFGLFAEDVETSTTRLTGNFPQGYSHLAFIQTVLLLETDYNWSDVYGVRNWLETYAHRQPVSRPQM
jgi:alpha,alpha-trehalase